MSSRSFAVVITESRCFCFSMLTTSTGIFQGHVSDMSRRAQARRTSDRIQLHHHLSRLTRKLVKIRDTFGDLILIHQTPSPQLQWRVVYSSYGPACKRIPCAREQSLLARVTHSRVAKVITAKPVDTERVPPNLRGNATASSSAVRGCLAVLIGITGHNTGHLGATRKTIRTSHRGCYNSGRKSMRCHNVRRSFMKVDYVQHVRF